MILGNWLPTKSDVALATNKRWIFFLLVQLKVQSSAIITGRRDVTSFRTAA